MKRIILASGSQARRAMLENAGLIIDVRPAAIDEQDIQKTLKGQSPTQIAQALADEKALAVSREAQGALVIGSDQVLECDGEVFSKAPNKEEARAKLSILRDRSHRLISAVTLAQDGKILWRHHDQAELTMHHFSAEFLERYLEAAGENITQCVGAYALEGRGIQLFEAIKGDYFTILGMPLLPLLRELRQTHGVSL